MNNEPVAWLKNGNVEWIQYPMDMSKPVPLYTHPVKELKLTDEEIDEIYGYCFEGFYEDMTFNHIKFARAILRKAQENER